MKRTKDPAVRVDSTGSRPDGLSHESHEHAERAMEILSPAGPLLVAFSGGADSALVLTMAVRTLGAEQVIAATSVAPSVARSELVSAEAFTAELGVRHEWPHTREIERADYRANGRDRCYFCKSELADTLLGLAEQLKCRTVITGTNADDAVDPFRPGIRAADERGVIAPLRDAGITKHEVREISRAWGLRTWDKPANPCLASRIAYGLPIDAARLGRVEAAEELVRQALKSLGAENANLRVRDLGERVRVELDAPHDQNLQGAQEIHSAITRAGFTGIPIDIGTFRSGALNIIDL
ncbi:MULTISPECIES: ATP-dependent sacrificial sulfur transferase LarE [Streptomyces]|uniref:ATP-dependent sacrificial sulfur transferase LarE n=1 Tax=Streptomyces TaxID=1883 RepID=UPI001ED8EE68|nr:MULTISPECIES: ATP-dependent sacrificial sulfur transferase LarE [Streptomyces]MCX4487891.1 ATP-dependent sacrificial sulfur transferase LarE [Streptomyces anulatus]MCX4521917.1 ATP-dependent sacrificial sulfur transferase LarE [Streptomyces anulatus]MCX4604793.1 ATP-dependent sacrificial sulfur transferase LarE [Streptomyces anulatus]WSI81043.1 ATP-dependent sacrificial sulfur transferase LarE [Streptomyces anulatus]WTD24592.1 ATP-dependent sacrificial sulfur transferase LarE [Streptomyces 